jgi:hypothetical protein
MSAQALQWVLAAAAKASDAQGWHAKLPAAAEVPAGHGVTLLEPSHEEPAGHVVHLCGFW